MEMKFNANIKNVSFARGVASCFLIENDLTLATINEIKTIVSEAVTNAIVHGYGENDNEKVYMSLEIENSVLKMIIKDEGVGILDIEKAKAPLYTTKIDEERAGLGFTIMDIFSDSLEIVSKIGEGTTIICYRKLE